MGRFDALPPRDVSWYGDPRDHGARCDLCPLASNVFVPYSPPKGKLRLVLVGEGPGRKEEILRTPFTGVTGEHLDRELEEVRLERDEAHVTNAAMCASDNEQDNARAAECCAPRLLTELSELSSEVPIITLGKAATRTVLGVKSILLARGFVWTARDLEKSVEQGEKTLAKMHRHAKETRKDRDHEKAVEGKLRLDTLRGRAALAGRTVFPTLHPTFAFIHNENWATIFGIDLDRAARWIRGELRKEHLADNIVEVKTLSALRARTRVFAVSKDPGFIREAMKLLGSEVAVDIETERQKPLSPLKVPILTVQISDGKRGLVIGPWDKEIHASVLTEVLRGRVAILHNGFCFDQIALARDGVSFEEVTLEDTLTGHHTFASAFPQKLDHVVATFLDSGPWKIRFGVRSTEEKGLAPQHVDEGDLELYGAVDAFVTKQAWNAMQGDLAPERSVYEHDKRRSLLYRQLQVNGYKVDQARKELLSKLLKRRAAFLKGRMRRIARRPGFEPSKVHEVRKVLFGVLKAPVLNPTPTGLAGTSNATLESLRTGDVGDKTRSTKVGRFSETLLHWRVTTKTRGTYIDPVDIHSDGRAHYNFKPFGVLTGRPASRILSCPRWSRDLVERARELYTCEEGNLLVYFDLAQAEGRFAANLSADKGLIEACAVDLHTRNALVLFAALPGAVEKLQRDPKGKNCPRHSEKGSAKAACNCGKPLRDVTKNVGFAILYQAGPKKVFAYLRSQGFPVDFGQVEDMFVAMRDTYPDYARFVAENIRYVEKHGYLRTALVGRLMRLGFHPEPSAVANLPIQSGIADVMDTRLLDVMVPSLPPGGWMVLHHYDSATFEVAAKYVEWTTDAKGKKKPAGKFIEMIEDTWKEPIRLQESIVCRQAIEFVIPAEVKVGTRWSDM